MPTWHDDEISDGLNEYTQGKDAFQKALTTSKLRGAIYAKFRNEIKFVWNGPDLVWNDDLDMWVGINGNSFSIDQSLVMAFEFAGFNIPDEDVLLAELCEDFYITDESAYHPNGERNFSADTRLLQNKSNESGEVAILNTGGTYYIRKVIE